MDNNTLLAASPADLITSNRNNIEHVCKILCLSLSSFACFLSKLPLILMVGRKRNKRAGDICKGTLNIEFEQD